MRTSLQIIASAVVLAAAGGGWYAWTSLSSASQTQQTAGGPAAQGRIGGPPPAARGPGGQRGRSAGPEVDVTAAKTGLITDTIETVGTARANEAVTLTAKQAGIVVRVVFTEGQFVKEGDVLIELEARERKADLETARAQYDEVRAALERSRQLRGSGSVTAARLEDLEAQTRAAQARVQSAEARRADLMIAAPFSGRVGMRQVSPGALVSPGAPITTLDDLSVIKVEFAVPQTVLGSLKPGLTVRAHTSAFADRQFEGQISVIDTRVDPVTRAVRVVAKFDNRDELLKPGLFVDVVLEIGQRSNAVLVPEESIVSLGTSQYVFRIVDGRAVRTEVVLGSRQPGVVEITKGVAAGELVIVRGVQKVRDGQPVRTPNASDIPPAQSPRPTHTSQS